MIKRVALTVTTAGLTALGLAVPMSTLAHASTPAHAPTVMRPQNNFPPRQPVNLYNEGFPSDCARIDANGVLIVGSGDCTTFTYNSLDTTLVEGTSINGGSCLWFDFSHFDAYDIGPCGNGSNEREQWRSSSSNAWSQWWTVYNLTHGALTMWADGTGVNNPLFPAGQNGTSPFSHWQTACNTCSPP